MSANVTARNHQLNDAAGALDVTQRGSFSVFGVPEVISLSLQSNTLAEYAPYYEVDPHIVCAVNGEQDT